MLNVVCYQSSDIEMLLRVAKEFNLKVQVLHDATDAHTMTSTLLENNIKYIAVSQQSNWVGRVEGYYGASHHAIEKLNKAGIQVLIKSDHPFGFHARYLMHHVAISHHYGLPADAALRSVTSTAAKSLGIDTCTGSIVEGMAADLITWDRNPLQLGARVDRVIIDGEVVLEQKIPKLNALGSIDLTSHELQGAVDGVSTFAIKNVRVYTGKQVLDNVNVVVTSGKIICIGNTCTVPEGHPQVTLQGGVLTPGMIEVDSHLGLQEIPSEDNTNDGTSLGSNRISASQVRAADGVRTLGNSKSLENAYRAGILSAVSSPISNAVITGLSVAFDTNCQRPFDQAIIKEEVGLHIGIGAENKQTGTIVSSISGQMNELRGIFSRKTSPTVVRVLSGELPIIAHVNSADNIIQVLRFKALAKVPRMVIVGGAEAHLIAELVARENVSVVLTPWKAMHSAKENWDTMNANMTDFGVETLRKANVKVGLAMGNLHNVHHLRWLAGYARGGSPTSDTSVSEAIASVTSNLAEMFDVPQVGRIQVNSPANFVLFDGNPLSFESRVKLVVSGGVLDVNVAPL
jgi:imidazolonepropionase-like amidohydrolase